MRLDRRKDMPLLIPVNTVAIAVAVTLCSGGNQTAEMARGADPTAMLAMPFSMEQMWQETVNVFLLTFGSWR